MMLKRIPAKSGTIAVQFPRTFLIPTIQNFQFTILQIEGINFALSIPCSHHFCAYSLIPNSHGFYSISHAD